MFFWFVDNSRGPKCRVLQFLFRTITMFVIVSCSTRFAAKEVRMLLEYWMTEYGIEIPWKFYQMRDVRTIRDFLSKTAVTALTEQYIEEDNKHIAVYDAYLEAQIIKYCRDHLTKSSDE